MPWDFSLLCQDAGGNEQLDFNVTYIPPNEFLLGPEDILVVNVWRNQELSREVIIRPDGKISMPLIGDVQAAGMTANVLAKRIADGLAEFMSNPTVSVQVKEVNSYYVYVLGEVQKPGKVPLKSYATVLQGVSWRADLRPLLRETKSTCYVWFPMDRGSRNRSKSLFPMKTSFKERIQRGILPQGW
ncbi:MAG: polysaccharide biosynthesis/export family protein [Nitrospiraceae bacterium]